MVRNKTQSTSSSSSGNASGSASNSSSSTKSPIRQNSANGNNINSGARTHRKSSSTCSVALADDSKPTSSSNRRSPPQANTNTSHTDEETDGEYDRTPTGGAPSISSVHKQNLYIVSFPIIFLFNILRSLIYQLFCIFRYVYGASTKVIYRPHKRECNIEIVVGSNKSFQNSQNENSLTNEIDKNQIVQYHSRNSALATYPLVGGVGNITAAGGQQRFRTTQQLEMSGRGNASSSPGPGDPLLAKQKHHHRRAFEYISKALKIDEENEGHKELAIELYRKGIKELEDGIAVDCWSGRGDVWERAQRLHDKMQTNLSMARDRLHFLELREAEFNFHTLKLRDTAAQQSDKISHKNKVLMVPPMVVNGTGYSNSATTCPSSAGTNSRLPSSSYKSNLKSNRQLNSDSSKPSTCSSSTLGGRSSLAASGRKLTVSSKRPGNLAVTNKSQTLPRNLGSKNASSAAMQRQPVKTAATPPAVRRQFSSGRNTPPQRARTPINSSSNYGGQSGATAPAVTVKGVEQKLVQIILDEIVEGGAKVEWSDIAGQEVAKQALQEMVILPSVRPELFTGLRAPAKGLLLFGPPGNGKTLLARAVATECSATFLNISAASLTSKYVGDGEKLVRALFAVAREMQPSIIFIDEVDSLLSERSSNEHEASRRLKTEFLVEFDGLPGNPEGDRIVVLAATNRPQELDEAALRRFTKRVYVSLPDLETRELLLSRLLEKQGSPLGTEALRRLAKLTDGYSGSDLTALAKDAALEPIRELNMEQVKCLDISAMRPITEKDFHNSLKRIRRSVASQSLNSYEKWSQEYGDITI
ncbi:spastin isoform X1 [Anastrepha ludens]|uniref:spastin isoform X1 n=1 Tax=Anastrepha ludens TaxID=28586 RepID=UPI0023AF9848|nr:spastin isoform X1 [Anastrepha ludens]XP_053945835.1 spastin isoform X1 [Anastrepha ludens]